MGQNIQDITQDAYSAVSSRLKFSIFMEDEGTVGKELVEKLKDEKFPKLFHVYLQHCLEYMDNNDPGLNEKQKDQLFSFMLHNFAFCIELLDLAQNPESYEDKSEVEEAMERQQQRATRIVEDLTLMVKKVLVVAAEDDEDAKNIAEMGDGKEIEVCYRDVPKEHWPVYLPKDYTKEGESTLGRPPFDPSEWE